MISEKTVELNLTTEWLNYLFRHTRRVHFAIAPSQRAEAIIPIDAAISDRAGGGVLIQYKRAIVKGTKWRWQLNHTVGRNQHQKLQKLEQLGYPVFYGFPFFSTPFEVARFRRRLLKDYTFFFRPSWINPPGGPIGHHDVVLDTATKTWRVSSPESAQLRGPIELNDITESLAKGVAEDNLWPLMAAFDEQFPPKRRPRASQNDPRLLGASIVGRLTPLTYRCEKSDQLSHA